jgi:hypothetical protein
MGILPGGSAIILECTDATHTVLLGSVGLITEIY